MNKVSVFVKTFISLFTYLFFLLSCLLQVCLSHCSPSGQFFVVEEDLRELAQLKVDKRFVGMLNMLRHCQRLKELRGGGVTRYMLL